jgi:hypothetical protein
VPDTVRVVQIVSSSRLDLGRPGFGPAVEAPVAKPSPAHRIDRLGTIIKIRLLAVAVTTGRIDTIYIFYNLYWVAQPSSCRAASTDNGADDSAPSA